MTYITNKDPLLEIRRGNTDGQTTVTVIGHNDAVGTSFETIWREGGIYVMPTSAVQMTFSSSDANDTSAGTGLRTALHTYLDGSYVQQTEIVTMNGQTGVNSVPTDLFRSISLTGLTAGSGGVNAGIIYVGTGTVTAGKPAVVFGIIAAGDNLSHHGFYTVPAGKTAFPVNIIQSVEGNKFIETQLLIQQNGGLRLNLGQIDVVAQAQSFPLKATAGFIAQTDIWFDSKIDAGTGSVNVTMDLILIDD